MQLKQIPKKLVHCRDVVRFSNPGAQAVMFTLPRNELLCQLLGGLGSNEFHINEGLSPMAVKKNQNPGGRFVATS